METQAAASVIENAENHFGERFSIRELDELVAKVAKHPVLGVASPQVREQAMNEALRLHGAGYAPISKEEYDAYKQSFLHDGVKKVEQAFEKIQGKGGDAAKHSGLKNYRANSWVETVKHASTEQKVYGGMSLLMAALCTMGAVKSFGNATTSDADGKSQVQWSNVGLGLLNAAFAAGSAYALHQQFKAR